VVFGVKKGLDIQYVVWYNVCMKNKFCLECEKKINGSCKKICKRLEQHLEQDVEVKRREEYLTELQESCLNGSKLYPEPPSNTEIILQLFFIDKKTYKYIAKTLNISERYIYKTIAKYKKIMKETIKKSVKNGSIPV